VSALLGVGLILFLYLLSVVFWNHRRWSQSPNLRLFAIHAELLLAIFSGWVYALA
jgi:hypothetical protein